MPLTRSQEIALAHSADANAIARLDNTHLALLNWRSAATAVGRGINAPKTVWITRCAILAERTGLPMAASSKQLILKP